MNTVRIAEVRGTGPIGSERNLKQVEAYLYANYTAFQASSGAIVIVGTDSAGFTLEAIRDRLASGLIAIEILDT